MTRTQHTNYVEDCHDCGYHPLIVAYFGNGEIAYVKCGNKTCTKRSQRDWKLSAWNKRHLEKVKK